MDGEQTIPAAIEGVRKNPQVALSEVAQAAANDWDLSSYYNFLLSQTIQSLDAVAAAVWQVDDAGQLQLARQVNLAAAYPSDRAEAPAQHEQFLRKLIEAGPPQLTIPPALDEAWRGGNPLEFLLIVGPLMIDKQLVGIVEVLQKPELGVPAQAAQLRYVLQMCGLAGDYLKTFRLRELTDRQALWGQIETFSRDVHQSLDRRDTCYIIANEGRRLIECDRLSVAILRGRRCRVVAVSGQDSIDERSYAVRSLNYLATVACAAGDEVWYSGDASDLAPQVEEAVQDYVDDSHATTLVVIPLRRPSPPRGEEAPAAELIVGALIAESFGQREITPRYRQRLITAAAHSATALANVSEYQEIFLMPVWRRLGKLRSVAKARAFPKVLSISIAAAVLLLALCIIPGDFHLPGKGTVEPVVKRDVFAGVSGTVTEIKAERGPVHAGDPLLIIDSADVKTELLRLQADRDSKLQDRLTKERLLADAKLSESEKIQIRGEIQTLKAGIDSLEKQIRLVTIDKLAHTTVTSPIDGEIISWQVRERLDRRPVEKGQVLMTVAALDQEWELEIRLPEERMGYLNEALQKLPAGEKMKVSYIVASDPGAKHMGYVKEIHRSAEIHGEEGNTVLIRVAIDKQDLKDVRPGAGVTAKFDCGRRAIAFVWFHDVLAFIQSKILF